MDPVSEIPILIRQAGMPDFDAIVRLVTELHHQHYLLAPHIFIEPDVNASRQYCLKYLNQKQHFLLVAERKDEIVGLLAICIHRSAENFMLRVDPIGYISLLIVQQNYRRIGVGKRLIIAAEKWLIDHRIGEMRLEVLEMNTDARHFYNSLGFINQSRQLSKFVMI
ncbi:MAG: hypothetical protein CENE_02987 [Candidatus Celerinatantimonas neptuna]|nr:MAG: hypothetical protein CENE_02987 [Candidatus Celerinatantimonas neptuna]